MTAKAQGVTFGNRQDLLQFITGRKPEELKTYLRRDRANTFDRYAVVVVVGIQSVGYAHIGYQPKGLSQSLSSFIRTNHHVRLLHRELYSQCSTQVL